MSEWFPREIYMPIRGSVVLGGEQYKSYLSRSCRYIALPLIPDLISISSARQLALIVLPHRHSIYLALARLFEFHGSSLAGRTLHVATRWKAFEIGQLWQVKVKRQQL